MTGAPLALVFATIDRPMAAQRLIRSARAHFPDMPIYVGDQTAPSPAMQAFYRAAGARVAWLPHDCGVAAARNAAVAMAEEPFFVLCDDDFIFTPDTRFGAALRLLRSAPEIGVVGGRLFDCHLDGDKLWRAPRHWELFLNLDQKNRLLTATPIHLLAPRLRRSGGVDHYRCDAVMNWAVMRRSMFDGGVSWDEQFTCNGEHEDFYLTLKNATEHQVAYLPTMAADHHHPPSAAYQKRRQRSEGWTRLMRKWGFDRHLEIGLGLRTIDAPDNLIREGALTRAAMFEATSPVAGDVRGGFVIGRDGRLSAARPFRALNDPTGGGVRFACLSERRGRVALTPAAAAVHRPADAKGDADRNAGAAALRAHLRCRAAHSLDEDVTVFVRPVGFSLTEASGRRHGLVCSWRIGDRVALHDAPIDLHRVSLQPDDWTALTLASPMATGLATLVLALRDPATGARRALGAIETLFGMEDAADAPWIDGYAPTEAKPVSGVSRGGLSVETRFWRAAPCGTALHLVSITGAGLKDMRGGRMRLSGYPYAFGGGRLNCLLPIGETELRFMIPAEPRIEMARVSMTISDEAGALWRGPLAQGAAADRAA